jgi:hypothetical protein
VIIPKNEGDNQNYEPAKRCFAVKAFPEGHDGPFQKFNHFRQSRGGLGAIAP